MLCVGDSTIRQIRSSLELLLKNSMAVDFLASYSIIDSKLMKYVRLFFEGNEYSYDVIVLQYGGHHGFHCNTGQSENDRKIYCKRYMYLAKFLRKKCKNLVILSATPERQDSVNEREIINRNFISQYIARKLRCVFFDIYAIMKKAQYEFEDHCHFKKEANIYEVYWILTGMVKEGGDICLPRTKRLGETKLLIYGTGFCGNELYWVCLWHNLGERISAFVETEVHLEMFQNVPMIQIDKLQEEDKNSILIISSENMKIK